MLDNLLSARPGGSAHHKPPPATSSLDASVSSDRGINFTMFLTMMSERLFEFDPEAELREAFECFDEGDTGTVRVDEMRKWMSEVGERMDQQEVRFALAFLFVWLISCTDRQVP
jgi:myosin regulatory light chain 12